MHKYYQILKILLLQHNIFHNNASSSISLLQFPNNYGSNTNDEQNVIVSLNNKSKTKTNIFGISSNNFLSSLQLSFLLSQIKVSDYGAVKIRSLPCTENTFLHHGNVFGTIKSYYRQFVDKYTQLNMISDDDILNDMDNYNLMFPTSTSNVSTSNYNDTLSFLEESYESIKNVIKSSSITTTTFLSSYNRSIIKERLLLFNSSIYSNTDVISTVGTYYLHARHSIPCLRGGGNDQLHISPINHDDFDNFLRLFCVSTAYIVIFQSIGNVLNHYVNHVSSIDEVRSLVCLLSNSH